MTLLGRLNTSVPQVPYTESRVNNGTFSHEILEDIRRAFRTMHSTDISFWFIFQTVGSQGQSLFSHSHRVAMRIKQVLIHHLIHDSQIQKL